MFVIYKSSRAPTEKSYSGPSWDRANIRNLYKEQYDNYDEAVKLANELSKINPAGFSVHNLENNS